MLLKVKFYKMQLFKFNFMFVNVIMSLRYSHYINFKYYVEFVKIWL